MAAITYTANARAPLITTTSPAHTAGTQYSFDLKLQQYTQGVETPKQVHVAIGGNVETVLRQTTRVYSAVFIWPDTLNAQVEEFLFSVAGGETFSFSPYGLVGDSPDLSFDVVCVNTSYPIARLSHGSAPWRSVALTLRPAV